MAKTYINSVKYMIKISFEVGGAVDKPDIVGAIFGQSEGLLGEEMDLKELQKNGKIGRIEINHTNVLGKTRGEIFVPSSMDIVQTSLLAAAVESVDKVGPYDSQFKILTIDDVRTEKRQEIKSRAQQILEKFKEKMQPDTTELTESLREGSRTAELVEFGQEKLPAGPEVAAGAEIIVVEGRADVINLLKNSIKNAIAMNGSQIPQAIIELSKHKEITIFVDGDRGGTLIARNFLQLAKASFVAKAPDGKEVEELARKEIIQSLRKRMPADEYLSSQGETHYPPRNGMGMERRGPRGRDMRPPRSGSGFGRGPPRNDRQGGFGERRMGRDDRGPRGPPRGEGGFGRNRFEGRPHFNEMDSFPQDPSFSEPPMTAPEPQTMPSATEQQKFQPIMAQLKNSLKAKLFDKDLKEIKEIETKNLVAELDSTKGVSSVVFDGIITKRLVDAADKNNVEYVVGAKKGKISAGKAKTLVIKG